MMIKLQSAMAEEGAVVRVQSPLGLYPPAEIASRDYAYLPTDDLVVTIARFRKKKVDSDWYYSDMEWAEPDEIRLWASIMLATDPLHGRTVFYPLPFATYVRVDERPLAEADVQQQITDLLRAEIAEPDLQRPGFLAPQLNPYRHDRGSTFPPHLGGLDYEFKPQETAMERQQVLFAAIDPADHLVVRGLGALIKSAMLGAHQQFIEEAATTLFISMEATYRLVLRRLRESGNNEPTAVDAGRFIDESFGGARTGQRYFEEYYESRVATLHAESRFGVFPFAPLMADDYYDLYEDLLKVYAFLLCGSAR